MYLYITFWHIHKCDAASISFFIMTFMFGCASSDRYLRFLFVLIHFKFFFGVQGVGNHDLRFAFLNTCFQCFKCGGIFRDGLVWVCVYVYKPVSENAMGVRVRNYVCVSCTRFSQTGFFRDELVWVCVYVCVMCVCVLCVCVLHQMLCVCVSCTTFSETGLYECVCTCV